MSKSKILSNGTIYGKFDEMTRQTSLQGRLIGLSATLEQSKISQNCVLVSYGQQLGTREEDREGLSITLVIFSMKSRMSIFILLKYVETAIILYLM